MKTAWDVKELAAVSAINYGYTESASSEPVGPRFLRITDIQDDQVDWENVPYCKIESMDRPKYRLASGDIVFARTGATTGKSFLVNDPPDAVFASYLIRLRLLDEKLMPEFVSLFFQTAGYWKSIKEGSAGSAQGGFNASKLGALSIPIPPLPEQQRIVGILNEAFDGIGTAKANAEKNLHNARALFESHLQSVFTKRGPGWVETTLSQATGGILTGPFGSLLHKSDYVANGIPLVNPAHITEVGIEPDLLKTVSKETALRLKSYIMREGDIVIGRRGEMGRCALVTEVEDGWLCGTGSFFIKPSSRCDTRYLVRFFRSEGCKGRLEKIAGGAVMPNLSNTDLGNLDFDLPPLDRQKAIVQEIDDLHEEIQHLESIYQQKLAALEALKKSLLHQAFTGRL
jgi:type I restriction enzyme S subunit